MLKKIGIGFAVVVGLFLIVVAMQPSDFRIQRSAEIQASPAIIFPLISDLHAWDGWSPWAKLDPNMKKTFSGPAAGKGAIYEWSGNDKVGSGRMEIVDLRENDRVTIKLEFLAPFKATNTAEFALAPKGPATTVAWSMTGTNNFMAKAFGLFMNMDKLVGGDFEKGLAELKRQAESRATSK